MKNNNLLGNKTARNETSDRNNNVIDVDDFVSASAKGDIDTMNRLVSGKYKGHTSSIPEGLLSKAFISAAENGYEDATKWLLINVYKKK